MKIVCILNMIDCIVFSLILNYIEIDCNYNLEIKGIPQIFLSDSQNVVIYPKHQKITMKKNRDFDFEGTIIAGLFTFFGQDFDFNYDTFKINLHNLDSLKIKDLRLMEIKLNKKIDDLNGETRDIANTIQRLFENARETKTKSEEVSIANRIKTLNQKKDMKQSAVMQREKELRGVSNLLILKENEKDLKESGAWKKLQKMNPEKMERWLTSKTLEQRSRQDVLDNIVSMTSEAMESVDYDSDLDDILDTIREVKVGDLEAEEASKKVMKEKQEEKEVE